MNFLLLIIVALAIFGWIAGMRRIKRQMVGASVKQHSRSHYHSLYLVLSMLLPAFVLIIIWQLASPVIIDWMLRAQLGDIENIDIVLAQIHGMRDGVFSRDGVSMEVLAASAYVGKLELWSQAAQNTLSFLLVIGGFVFAWRHIAPRFRARRRVEKIIQMLMLAAASLAIITTLGIVLSLIFETIQFFRLVPVSDFLFGTHWSPQIPLDVVKVEGSAFGAIPLFVGTLLITFIAMSLAVPIGLMSAVYLSEYASRPLRNIAKPAIEILAGIPTVVYGFFAALIVAPALRDGGAVLGLSLSSESALAAGLVMGVMIIPFVSSLSDDVINAVPQNLRDGAAALGATQSETIRQIILPAALPGIMSAILLAISRAIGETMIVVMAAGVAANLTINPFESLTTVTVQIVMLLIGDQEFDSAKTLAAFALGMVLFVVTLMLNILALYIVRKYREQYE